MIWFILPPINNISSDLGAYLKLDSVKIVANRGRKKKKKKDNYICDAAALASYVCESKFLVLSAQSIIITFRQNTLLFFYGVK